MKSDKSALKVRISAIKKALKKNAEAMALIDKYRMQGEEVHTAWVQMKIADLNLKLVMMDLLRQQHTLKSRQEMRLISRELKAIPALETKIMPPTVTTVTVAAN